MADFTIKLSDSKKRFYAPSEISVKIIDRLLIIKACKKVGVSGVNIRKDFVNVCRKLDSDVDSLKLKAYYKKNLIFFTTQAVENGLEMLPINIFNARNTYAVQAKRVLRSCSVDIYDALCKIGF